MIDFAALQDAFFDWIDGLALSPAIGSRIVWEDQKAPRPAKPYISLRITDFAQIGRDAMSVKGNASGQVTIVGNRELMLSFQCYGTGAMSILEAVRSSLERPTIIEYFFAKKIAGVDPGPVLDVARLIDDTIEERASMDIRFRTVQDQLDPEVAPDPPEYIETVNLDRQIDVQDTTIIDDTITIPPT